MAVNSSHIHSPLSFSLRFLFLATTFAAACCTLVVTLPGWGTLLAVILVSVFARTCLIVHHRAGFGVMTSRTEQLSLFARSLVRMVLALALILALLPVAGLLIIVVIFSALDGASKTVLIVSCAVLTVVLLVKMATRLGHAILARLLYH